MPRIRLKVPLCQFCNTPLIRRKLSGRVIYEHDPDRECIGPPTERSQHTEEEIARVPRLVDPDGRAVSLFRAKTALERLFERQVIDADQLDAGLQFHAKFRMAHFNGLKAFDFTQPPRVGRATSDLSERAMNARHYVWSRIQVLGGLASLPGSCCWNVIGLEMSLAAWALERALHDKPIDAHGARGVLISVLTTLAVNPTATIWCLPRNMMHEPLPTWAPVAAAVASA